MRTLAVVLACAALAAADTASPDLIARGKYLVTQVSMCIDCHSPRDQQGKFIQEQWLQGGPLTFAPTVPMPVWAAIAMPIKGGGPWNDAYLHTLLTTAKRPGGSQPRPPMPAYEMNDADADAVIAYLRSTR